ncbi:MAG: serine/threonine-protein kinase [Gemmataceae bacterium]
MKWLSDATLEHLRQVADWPDLTGTKYEVVEKVGQGGMGSVYLATDQELDRPVALKVVNSLPGDQEATASRIDEARILARLEHPGIVPVHDAGMLPDGRFYYAMKYVRGQRLDDPARVRETRDQRLQLFSKVCQAVSFAHAQGVIHRDLKPANIMTGPFGEVLVMDWGLASVSQGDLKDTGNGQAGWGTPGYMAPEQAQGRGDERTDVYALGGILYFLLTARGPGSIKPRRVDSTIPRALEAVCLKALSEDRDTRYASVTALMDDLHRFQEKLPVTAYPEGLTRASLRLASKYRVPIGLILAYLAMRVMLMVWGA